ncbi:MAG: outer membrane protein assembly factor BamC [Gammaproteobacteria bacterium]|nr:outer membrane protein assembly factor BamC [Gammaproteobacteria bacterium]
MTKRWVGGTALLLTVALVGGCSMFGSKDEKKISYQTKTAAPPSLEVPPDLSSPSAEGSLPVPDSGRAATYSGYTTTQQQAAARPTTAVVPDSTTMRIERAGAQRWLVVQGDPDALWPAVRAFFVKNGLGIAVENRASGVLETDWAENRATAADDFIYRYLSKVFPNLYSTGLKDKFRVRLERGQAPGTTDIFLTHRGMEEVVPGGNIAIASTSSVWQARAPDPEIENEMLRLLMVHLGADEKKAQGVVATAGGGAERARVGRDAKGYPVLTVEDTLDRAWRRIGLSLDRVGFTVEDRDRSKGIYYVRYIDPAKESGGKGMFSWLIGDDEKADNRYQVSLATAGNATEVSVLDSNGTRDKSKTSERILNLLYEQMK